VAETVNIQVDHITRVEGHGNIVLRARDGHIEKLEWQVPEAPRFFEAMVKGRSWQDIQTVVSRICGICSVSHSLAALKAVEAAFGMEIPPQMQRLRLLCHYGEQLESHSLHLGYLVAPDLLGQKSVLPLIESHPDLVRAVMKAHSTGNRWMEVIGGRMTHPVRLKVGGFTKLPTEEELVSLRTLLEECLPALEVMADALHDLADRLPDFRRETEYVALVRPGEYTFYEGHIGSTDTEETVPPAQFEKVANEYVSPQSTAKWARWHRESYMVGALARFNLNGEYLLPRAAATASKLGLEKGNCNPYWNNIAQMVECVQVVEDGIRLIDALLEEGLDEQSRTVPVTPRDGEGAAAVEAPRGILFHRYRFDSRGFCIGANMCIPTNQNHANIQKDFEKLVPEILDRDQEEIRLMLEMLVRAYDPCISCSTHYLDVTFV